MNERKQPITETPVTQLRPLKPSVIKAQLARLQKDHNMQAGELNSDGHHEPGDRWEYNHNLIAEAMSDYMRRHERIPTKTELAKLTGLCRATIYKHLNSYATQPEVQQQESQLRVMYAKLLSRMYTYGMNGDVKAARLYIETVDRIKEGSEK